jgi:non-haem Fe2+, alpha-ketoglutarate-dependent halogenase
MPKVLTQAQVDLFGNEGFISPIDVMSEEEALGFKQRLEAAEHDYPDEVNAHNRNNAHLSLAFLDELAHHPIVTGAVQDLMGASVSLWGSVLFIKDPGTVGYVSWHQDATYMGLKPHDFVTPWIALTHSNRTNGCMSMIPGSHVDHIRPHDDTYAPDNILTRGQTVQNVDASIAVDLILKPGQMSLHHAEIIHGSQPNLGEERRIGFALQSYAPPHVRQTLGKNYWLPVGDATLPEGGVAVRRPQYDMDPRGVEERLKINENFSDILYHDAEQRRAY